MLNRRRPYSRGPRRRLIVSATIAVGAVAPLASVAIVTLTNQSVPITEVAREVSSGYEEVALSSAPLATDIDADISGGPQGTPVREVHSDTAFSMVGVTWSGKSAGTAQIRAQNPDGSWSQWWEAESLDGGPDNFDSLPTSGTEPVFLGQDTHTVQIMVEGIDINDSSLNGEPIVESPSATGAAAKSVPANPAPKPAPELVPAPKQQSEPLPAPVRVDSIRPVAESRQLKEDHSLSSSDIKAVLLHPGTAPTPTTSDANFDIAASAPHPGKSNADISVNQPQILSRSQWGADESIRCMDADIDSGLSAASVHHTAGSNMYSREQSAGIVRGIYTYHAVNLGWCDVGYNVLVDKYGQAFEGRAGGLTRNVQGAHSGGFNANTFGISMLGDHSTLVPSDATINKVGQVIGWRLSLADVDPKGSDTHYSEGTSFTFVPAGHAKQLPNVFAHRDVGYTTCPGEAGYAQMDRIRDIAASYAKDGTTTFEPDQVATVTPNTTQVETPPNPENGDSGPTLKVGSLDTELTIADIKVYATEAITTAMRGQIPALWSKLQGAAGPLGKALSGIQNFKDVSYVKFDRGAIYQAPDTGTHTVWGKIGDAWAAQGFEHGPLGMPETDEQEVGSKIWQRFSGGTLEYDPATRTVRQMSN